MPSILNPDRQVQPGVQYADFDTGDFQARAIKLRTEAREIFLSPGK